MIFGEDFRRWPVDPFERASPSHRSHGLLSLPHGSIAGSLMFRQFALAVAFFLVAPLAVAGNFYIGGSVGVSIFDDTVDTATPSLAAFGQLPNEISLNGRSFDSNETASGFTIGWNEKDWFSVELGYTDFGNSGQSLPSGLFGPAPPTGFFGPLPTVTLADPPIPIPPNIGVAISFPVSPNLFAAALSVEEWSITAKFRKSLISDLAANWSIGVTRAQFDAEGQLTVNEIVSLDPLVLNTIDLPYASPKDETGFNFGFGLEWRFSERFSADIGYRRHDTRVIDVETVTLQLIVTL